MAEATTVTEAINNMKGRFNGGAAKGMNSVYQFKLTGDNAANYQLAITDGALDVKEGEHEKPSITVTMSAADFIAMTNGKLNPQMAFMSGKLRVSGDMALAMKMQQLFPTS